MVIMSALSQFAALKLRRTDGRTHRIVPSIHQILIIFSMPSFSISLPMLFCFAKKLGWAKNLVVRWCEGKLYEILLLFDNSSTNLSLIKAHNYAHGHDGALRRFPDQLMMDWEIVLKIPKFSLFYNATIFPHLKVWASRQ